MPPLSEITQAEISPDLGNILRLAASTHTKLSDVDTGTGERFNINFASLFVAFLTVDRPDPVSRWFRAYAKAANIDTVAILAKERVGEAAAIDVSQQVSRSSTPVEASIDKALADLYLTQSAGGILREAETIRQSRQLRYLDCQLIMGVLVYRAPVDHPDNLEIWRFNKVDWAADYLTFLFAFNPSEIPYWQKYYAAHMNSEQSLQLKTLLPVENLKSYSESNFLGHITARVLMDAQSMAAREINPPIPLTTTCLFWAIADYALKDNNSDLHSLFSEGFTADEQNALSQRRREYVTGDFWNGFQEITSTASVALSDGMTRYVGRVVELAHHYSGRQDSSKGRIGPSHLLFALLDRDALLSNSSSDELGIFGLLRATEIDPQQLRQKVRNILAQYLDNQQVGYGTDTVTTNDLLNIDVLVKPLAMLVAAHTTVPPLAIGIFGDWGSGKSFFMNRLKQQICLLAANAKASGSPQKDISFFKHIICIDFNAWHYVESNLWASLMEHIFAELSKQGVYSDALGAPLRPSDESQKKVLEIQIVEKQKKLEAAKKELDTQVNKTSEISPDFSDNIKIVINIVKTMGYQDELKPILSNLESQQVNGSVQDLTATLDEARQTLLQGQTLLELLRRSNFTLWHWILLIVLVVVIPLLIGFVANSLSHQDLGQIATVVSSLAISISALAHWLTEQSKNLKKVLLSVENAQTSIDETVHGQANRALKNVEDLTQQLDDLIAQRRALDPDQILIRFIKERAESNDYRSYLGLLTTVRRDFESLSTNFGRTNQVLFSENPDEEMKRIRKIDEQIKTDQGTATLINRIVLFIDDLDRCPPNKVVEVLQAVNLLMAFPLFVAIVGVDSRWLARSLSSHYEDLLTVPGKSIKENQKESPTANPPEELVTTFGRDATPADYLEKIFQIPIWLPRLQPDGAWNIVRAMISPLTPPISRPEIPPLSDQPSTPASSSASSNQQQPTNQPPSQLVDLTPKDETEDNKVELVAPQLEFDPRELEAMNRIAPLLHRSPRAVKRFVNLYRLIKAGLSTVELDAFLNDGPIPQIRSFEIVLFLLALTTNSPELMPDMLNAIQITLTKKDGRRKANLRQLVDIGLAGSQQTEHDLLRSWMHGLKSDDLAAWADVPLEVLSDHFADVARYSFSSHDV